ncbi:MerR family transcriptional regulator [Alteromonas sp. ASW11-36]|uniref:MerR family transcriptional regulator n=1 Tax=Alteromonas arenosi TaxID=3055817 RepID=A0ABT7T146_9ALTE|nr:MerR family transcriptional regulator [Alteromonas sp. ASW11-36]MDM7862180.1 MerR family transcriptional regulator [Alteromonas sp. ASW11-36]
MKIGELAKRGGLTAHTLRFYEKKQLLVPQKSALNQYRDYTADDLATAQFIKRCKASGFSLEDTAALLQIKDAKDAHTCAEAKSITLAKRADLQAKITELQQMVATLDELAERCCGGAESAEFCSIIADLESRFEECNHDAHH